jgi:hypothetical protein
MFSGRAALRRFDSVGGFSRMAILMDGWYVTWKAILQRECKPKNHLFDLLF